MQKIDFDLPEIAFFMDKTSIFIPDDYGYEKMSQLVYKAFSLEDVPEEEVIEMVSSAETIEDCIDEYWLPKLSISQKDKATVRRMIELSENKQDLLLIFIEIIKNLDPESFEFLLFLRKAAMVL